MRHEGIIEITDEGIIDLTQSDASKTSGDQAPVLVSTVTTLSAAGTATVSATYPSAGSWYVIARPSRLVRASSHEPYGRRLRAPHGRCGEHPQVDTERTDTVLADSHGNQHGEYHDREHQDYDRCDARYGTHVRAHDRRRELLCNEVSANGGGFVRATNGTTTTEAAIIKNHCVAV